MDDVAQQKLIDITFQIAMTVANNPWFVGKTQQEIADWTAGQLRACGFNTKPLGSSWGVLTDDDKEAEKENQPKSKRARRKAQEA